MTKTVSLNRKWTSPIPTGKDSRPLPRSLWPAKRPFVWVVRWFVTGADGKDRRPSRSFDSHDDAAAFQAERQHELNTNPKLRTETRQLTIGQYVEEFRKQGIGANGDRLQGSTCRMTVNLLTRLATAVGQDRKMSDIGPADANRFFQTLRETEKLAAPTVAKIKRQLKAAFSAAVYLQLLRENPIGKLKIKTTEPPPIRYVTPDEFQAILKAVDEEPDPAWWRTFLTVLYTAGLRFSEAAHLTWPDLDFDKDEIRVSGKAATAHTLEWKPKTPRSIRSIPVPPTTMALLATMQTDAPVGHPYVFASPERVAIIKAALERGWQDPAAVLRGPQSRLPDIVLRAARKVNTLATWTKTEGQPPVIDKPTVCFHDLRRSCITNWAAVAAMPTVMALAGHTSIVTTSKYYATTTKAQLDLARRASIAAVAVAEPVGSKESAGE